LVTVSGEKWIVKGEDGVWGREWDEGMLEAAVPLSFVQGVSLVALTQYQERLAGIRVMGPRHETVRIDSEAVRVWFEFRSARPKGSSCSGVCCEVLRDGGLEALEEETMYEANYCSCGLYLRDGAGNVHYGDFSEFKWPMFSVGLPDRLRGKDVRWLIKDGLELIKIADVELAQEALPSARHRHVLCLGVDRRWNKGVEGRGRRMGMYSLTGDMWEKAGPEKMVVEMD
jgi:hypothetical protein